MLTHLGRWTPVTLVRSGLKNVFIFSKLRAARSRVYRRQILQVNIRWKALDESYKIYMLLHRSDLNISEMFRQFFRMFLQNFAKNAKIFDENFLKY